MRAPVRSVACLLVLACLQQLEVRMAQVSWAPHGVGLLSCWVLRPAACMQAAEPCASECHEEQCDQPSLRYGRYCGLGHGGCPGMAPCDSVDGCCKLHDECVMEAGLLAANACHTAFIK
jgi:hypothetical protein